MAKHNELGKDGEQKVVDYLLSQGYQILERNWKAPRSRHELDIIATADNRVVFVEVKTRSTLDHGEPFDAVDERKVKSLVAGANSYVKNKHIDIPIRFDLVGVVDNEIIHLKNAFIPPARYRAQWKFTR